VKDRIEKARRFLESEIRNRRIIYGCTTGFGAFGDRIIPKKDQLALQRNLVLSHSVGVGNFLPPEVVRAMMLLRANTLAKGHSFISYPTVSLLVKMLNAGVVPQIPEKGSVGASGDLAPLAHMALPLIGEGTVTLNGKVLPSRAALRQVGLKPIKLVEGEGLALINGTQGMTAIGALAVHDSIRLAKLADVAASMSLEVLQGSRVELNRKIHEVRPLRGQRESSDNMRRLLRESRVVTSHLDMTRVQDAYSIRCSPQIHGASRNAIRHAAEVLQVEINSATDNPLMFPETGQILNGGNFHGEPVAMVLDYLAIGLAELANVSERRIERLVNPTLSGLPAFLVEEGGLNSGFMIAQYTAAALVSENKVLCHPASVDSIPTSANKEDHVSMGTISARKCREVLDNAGYVVAIEFLCAAQALDLFTNLQLGRGTSAAYRMVREKVTPLKRDRVLSEDVNTVLKIILDESFLKRIEDEVGQLV
jgi:histidine ammonia-lyase